MAEVLVDTSSILFGFENGKSVFEAIMNQLGERRILISKGIINELSIISKDGGAKGGYAKAAIKEIAFKKIKTDGATDYPDRWIERTSRSIEGVIVVTNDTALARKLPESISVLKFSKDGRLRSFVR